MAHSSRPFCVWQPTTFSSKTLSDLCESCNFPEEMELVVPSAKKNPERVPPGFCYAYTSYFTSCGLYFLLPKLFAEYLSKTGLCLSQLCPNFLRRILDFIKLAFDSRSSLRLRDLFHLGVVRKNSLRSGTLSFTAQSKWRIILGLPLEGGSWWTS